LAACIEIARNDFTQRIAEKAGVGGFRTKNYLRGAFLWVLIVTFHRAAAGTPNCGHCRARLAAVIEAGITSPVLYFPPPIDFEQAARDAGRHLLAQFL
jgi:superfamily I DNA/RNA helicase